MIGRCRVGRTFPGDKYRKRNVRPTEYSFRIHRSLLPCSRKLVSEASVSGGHGAIQKRPAGKSRRISHARSTGLLAAPRTFPLRRRPKPRFRSSHFDGVACPVPESGKATGTRRKFGDSRTAPTRDVWSVRKVARSDCGYSPSPPPSFPWLSGNLRVAQDSGLPVLPYSPGFGMNRPNIQACPSSCT